MCENRITLREILDRRREELTEAEWSQVEATGGAAALAGALAGLWAAARPGILGQVDKLLDVGLAEILARAWNSGRELRKYRDRESYPPDKTFEVALARHKVASKHEPRVEVWAGGRKRGEVGFTAEVEIAIEGMRLHIRDGRILKIETGECEAKGSLRCEGFLLFERETSPLRLPGVLDLDDGLEI